jgi:outer membrane receptor protein involved in Fe transport
MNLKYLVLSILFVLVYQLSAIAAGEDASPDGKMVGYVMDSANAVPVEFANLALYRLSDSALITGSITNIDGRFAFSDVPDGSYYMEIHFIGYEKKTIRNIILHENERRLNLGNIYLNLTSIQLEAAEVVGKRAVTEYRLDRKVINVSQDISNTGASAAQVLEKSPSVRVDIEGNVTLRGSSNFTVFIDGKPSVLDGNEALQQIPANTIENIEIITNPSVKYDPDGTSGIININLKKNRLKGFSGIIDLTAATGEKYAADLYANYKTGKFSFYGGIDWNDRKYAGYTRSNRETYGSDTNDYRDSEGDQLRLRNGLNFKAGIDYYMSDKVNLSLGGEYGNGGFGWDELEQMHDYTVPAGSERYYINDNQFRWKRNFYSLNAAYIQKFRQDGHNLKIFTFYSVRDGSQKQDQQERNTDEYWNTLQEDPFLLRSTEEGPSKTFRIEMDYVKPVLESGNIEAGYHYRINDETEDYYLETYDYITDDWLVDDRYTKSTAFNRSIHAVYGIFNHEISSFQYQLGLRGEYTYREITETNTGESSLVDRFDYFPSVHVAWNQSEANQFMASYSRRIDRPRGYFLEPFVTYVDESTRRIGNPDLLPEYTDSYEIGYLRALPEGSVMAEAYYRDTENKITRVAYYDEESGYFINTFRNLNDEQSLGIESTFTYDFTRWFNLNLSGTYYYYQVEDLTGESTSLRTSNNWDGRLITTFRLPTQTSLQLNLSYDSPSVTAQGKTDERYYADFTARQEFLKKNLIITFKVADLFGTRHRESYSYGDNFYEYSYRERESRVVSLTLSYRLNNFKQNPVFEQGQGEDVGM